MGHNGPHFFKPCISFFDPASFSNFFSNFFSNLAPLFSNLADLFFLTLAVCPTGPAGVELTASLKWGGGFPRFWMVAGFGRSSGEVLVLGVKYPSYLWASILPCPILPIYLILSHLVSSSLLPSHPTLSNLILPHPISSYLSNRS